MQAIRRLRALIWKQTERTVKGHLAGEPASHIADLSLTKPAAQTRRLFAAQVAGDGVQGVQVLEVDMLEQAGQLGAQEENFHRRSDAAWFTVVQRSNYPCVRLPLIARHDGVPWHREGFRGTERDGYPSFGSRSRSR